MRIVANGEGEGCGYQFSFDDVFLFNAGAMWRGGGQKLSSLSYYYLSRCVIREYDEVFTNIPERWFVLLRRPSGCVIRADDEEVLRRYLNVRLFFLWCQTTG